MPCGCCLLAGVGAFLPRIVLAFLWIFTDFVDRAFDNWIAPLAGLLLLPYTTLAYIALYAPGQGVSTLGWFIVVLGFFFDLANYTGGVAGRGRRVEDFYSRGV
ncbi:MAG: hypothetical protein EHM57_01155 [Actinobacteria bacterium]|nr:MAG: hypothetical protein EHM57_01155 [Actinomycetota bacterium]